MGIPGKRSKTAAIAAAIADPSLPPFAGSDTPRPHADVSVGLQGSFARRHAGARARPENLLLYLDIGSEFDKFTIRHLWLQTAGHAMTRNPIDIASRVSPRLSALLRARINNPESEQPVTLIAVRRFLADLLPIDFAQAYASEQLSRAIEWVVNDDNRENLPTLATVREALIGGLGARLVGDGVMDEDEDDTLLAEIEALIEYFGADSLAENPDPGRPGRRVGGGFRRGVPAAHRRRV